MSIRKSGLRLKRVSVLVAMALYTSSVFADATAYQVNIPAQRLDLALQSLAQQSGAQILFVTQKVAQQQSKPLTGNLTVEQALAALLKETNLQVKPIGDNKFSIVEAPLEAREVGQLPVIDVKAKAENTKSRATQLPVITINAENEKSYTVKKVQAGSKLEQDLKDIPRSISVIGRQQLDDQGISRLDDALEQLGVIVNPAFGVNPTLYSTRSFDLRTINVDGSASKSFLLFEPLNTGLSKYDNVQLVRGPDGLFSGNGQPSGSINLIRKRPTQDFQILTTLAGGSWNNYLGELDISSPLNQDKNIRGRAVVSYNDTEKFFENTHRKYTTLYGMIEADVMDNTKLSFGASYDNSDGTGQDFAPQYPRYTIGELLPISTKMGHAHGTLDAHQSTNFFTNVEHQFGKDWKAKLNISATNSQTDMGAGYYYGGVDPITDQGTRYGITSFHYMDSKAIAADFNLQGDLDLWGHENKLVFGADYVKTKNNYITNRATARYAGQDFIAGSFIDWNNFDPKQMTLTPSSVKLHSKKIDDIQQGICANLRKNFLKSIKRT